MGNAVGWFEIYVEDAARARGFYEKVFAVKLEQLPMPEPEMWMFPMDPDGTGSSGALVKMEGCPSGGNSTLVYFTCEDCAVEESRVPDAGGRVERAKISIGDYGCVSLVYDTENNMIGLHSLK